MEQISSGLSTQEKKPLKDEMHLLLLWVGLLVTLFTFVKETAPISQNCHTNKLGEITIFFTVLKNY